MAHYFLLGVCEISLSHNKVVPLWDCTPPTAGHSAAKIAQIHYFWFFRPQMRPRPRDVQQAVLVGGVSEEKRAGFYAASTPLYAED